MQCIIYNMGIELYIIYVKKQTWARSALRLVRVLRLAAMVQMSTVIQMYPLVCQSQHQLPFQSNQRHLKHLKLKLQNRVQ
ncbi:hypothetical protein EhV18_00447 [Emiliania huxleyi virus 18]|nr:hypothetical protein EhV18_00447 [Emiliania huxleyi virus 18]